MTACTLHWRAGRLFQATLTSKTFTIELPIMIRPLVKRSYRMYNGTRSLRDGGTDYRSHNSSFRTARGATVLPVSNRSNKTRTSSLARRNGGFSAGSGDFQSLCVCPLWTVRYHRGQDRPERIRPVGQAYRL